MHFNQDLVHFSKNKIVASGNNIQLLSLPDLLQTHIVIKNSDHYIYISNRKGKLTYCPDCNIKEDIFKIKQQNHMHMRIETK